MAGIIITPNGVMTHDKNGTVIPLDTEEQSMSIDGKTIYDYKDGILKLSMLEEDLNDFMNARFGKTKFDHPITFPVPYHCGVQCVMNVSEVSYIHDVTEPYYSFDRTNDMLLKNIAHTNISNQDVVSKEEPLKKNVFGDIYSSIKSYVLRK